MEFAIIILTTLAVIFLLQIIILLNQQKNGKLVRELIVQRTKAFQNDRVERGDRFPDRKENKFRQNRQDFRSKSQHAPSMSSSSGDVDTMEKSLRDINLKLKNAERDQEAARRRIQDNIGNKDYSRRRHHNDNNRGGRDNNRDHRRDRHNRRRNCRRS